MKNRLITNLLLATLVITLGLVTWLKPGQEISNDRRITSQDMGAINTIRIERESAETLVLKQENKQWQITKPFSAPALPGKIERLLKISQIKPPVSYPLNINELEAFGLRSPTARIIFNGEALSIGQTESVHSRRYVSNIQQLFLLDDTFLHHLTAPVDTYIDTRLLPDNIQITGLQTPNITLHSDENNIWHHKQNPSLDTSSDAVHMLLDEWRFARAIHVKYQPEKITGEDVTIHLSDNKKFSFTLIRQKDDIILISSDSKLAYTLSQTKYKKMTTLPNLDTNDA
ncbi:MAG: hypothetical protein A6F70_05905 [Cycloclasticus sp. symbiont of Bathymodiolus heckerae]|nr:MAG: hypothetical protein A6F70_05905 [Cycloclasticus sp. symbiont of Bathymodiolus heckerae]